MKGSKEYQVLSQDQVDDQDEVISVVEEMIERSKELTTVSTTVAVVVYVTCIVLLINLIRCRHHSTTWYSGNSSKPSLTLSITC